MTISKLTIAAVLGATLVSGCVAPDVVASKKVTDETMTCEDIQTQLGQLADIREEAQKGKTVSGKNVAAAVLFWPALIGNNMNANKALEAANEREAVLAEIAKKKRCKF